MLAFISLSEMIQAVMMLAYALHRFPLLVKCVLMYGYFTRSVLTFPQTFGFGFLLFMAAIAGLSGGQL